MSTQPGGGKNRPPGERMAPGAFSVFRARRVLAASWSGRSLVPTSGAGPGNPHLVNLNSISASMYTLTTVSVCCRVGLKAHLRP